MVDTSLVFNVIARTDQAERAFDKMSGRAKLIGAAIGGAAVIAGKALYDMAKAAAEDDKAQQLLARTLQNTAGATKNQIAATETWITKMASATGVADDQLRPAMMKLVGATHDTSKAQALLKKALDISAATGRPVEQVSLALAKAYNGQVAGLSRLGIKTTESVKDAAALERANILVAEATQKYNEAIDEHGVHSQEAALASSKLEYAQTRLGEAQGKTKKTTIDFAEAMKRVDDQFGGASASAANTYEGRMARLKNSFDETKESIGARLLPMLTNLSGWVLTTGVPALDSFGSFLDKNRKILVPLVAILGGLAAVVWTVNAAAKAYTAVQAALNVVLSANPIGLVVIGLAALAAGVIYAYKHSETFRTIVQGAFRGIATAASFMWDEVLKPTFSALVGGFLNVASVIIDGAARAFGWVPGIGGKLENAAEKFHEFKDKVNAQLNGINDETVKVTYEAVTVGFGRYAGKELPAQRSATGGPIRGAGTATSDSIPALLSNGEHVITAREVTAAGGHGAIQSFRRGLLRRANGGAIDLGVQNSQTGLGAAESTILAAATGLAAALGGPLRRALDWAGTQVGKPYIWGGVGPAGYDCSGFMSAIANVATGQSPYSRRFATGSMVGGGVGGFSRGAGGFSIGIMHGDPGHTAGTIMGTNVESRGGEGVVVGPRARGASNGLFSSMYHLTGFAGGGPVGDLPFDSVRKRRIGDLLAEMGISYDNGGYLPVGTSLVHNGTGRPEAVGGASIVIENLTLPNVTDPASFVKGLQDYTRRNGPIRGVTFA